MVKAGSIRPSQLITSFGPGSIVNMERDTVMVLGLQFWPVSSEKRLFRKITHPYLARQLRKSYFMAPVSDETSAIPCISFPRWGICQKCHRLQKHQDVPEGSLKYFRCRMCDSALPLFHAPFVQICNNGHMDEFPWDRWAHLDQVLNEDDMRRPCTRKDNEEPRLEYATDKKGTGLTNYIVRCLHCGASRSMTGATNKKNFRRLGFKECYGREPWLGWGREKRCAESVYGIQVNSSSLYYPHTVTSLLIPDWIHPVDEALDADDGKGDIKVRDSRKVGKAYEEIVDWYKNEIFRNVFSDSKNTQEIVIERLRLRYDDPYRDISTEGKALEQEFDNFSSIMENTVRGPAHDRKVDIEPMQVESSTLAGLHIDKLMKFHRLVSVQVLRGFARGVPWDPYATEEQIKAKDQFCHIYKAKTDYAGRLIPIDWLPAVETKGEGLFFKFDEEELQKWEERPRVSERFGVIVNSHAESISSQNHSEKKSVLDRFSSPRYILLHTFAHLLIREIAHHVGYGEASLRERIYSTSGKNPRNGILIYTSSSSSDGSLGGLVRLGDVDVFERIIRNAIRRSNSCSRDPLCGETDPVTMRGRSPSGMCLSGSSCYACTLLPETSCQYFNNLLDRWVVRDPDDGFFRNQITV